VRVQATREQWSTEIRYAVALLSLPSHVAPAAALRRLVPWCDGNTFPYVQQYPIETLVSSNLASSPHQPLHVLSLFKPAEKSVADKALRVDLAQWRFGGDLPHLKARKDLTDEFKNKMLCDNPVRFYRLNEGALAAARQAKGN
jgi:hypothetical protein